MSFAEAAARQLVNNHIKFAQEFADDSDDSDEDPKAKRNTILKALGVLGLGAGIGYGGYKAYPYVTKWLAEQGNKADTGMKSPPGPDDPNALSTIAKNVGKETGRNAIVGSGAGMVAGVGAAATGASNSRSPVGKLVAKTLGIRDVSEDSASRLDKLIPKDQGKKGNGGNGKGEAPQEPGWLSKAWNIGEPNVKPEHTAAASNVLSEAKSSGLDGPAFLKNLQTELRGSRSPVASDNPLLMRPAGPATSATPDKWQPNFNSMDQQRADALSSARTNPTDRSPLDALREVSSDAHQRTLEHHQALDAHAAATGTPGEAAAARAVFESAHRLAPAQAAMDRLLGPSATGKVIDRKQQLQRAKLLQTAGEQLPLLQKDHPSVTGNASKIVEPLSRGIKPTLRGGLYGAAGTLGYEALPYIRSGISSLFSSPPQAPQAPQQ